MPSKAILTGLGAVCHVLQVWVNFSLTVPPSFQQFPRWECCTSPGWMYEIRIQPDEGKGKRVYSNAHIRYILSIYNVRAKKLLIIWPLRMNTQYSLACFTLRRTLWSCLKASSLCWFARPASKIRFCIKPQTKTDMQRP